MGSVNKVEYDKDVKAIVTPEMRGVPTPSQDTATQFVQMSVEDLQELKRTLDWYKSERDYLMDRLKELEEELEMFPFTGSGTMTIPDSKPHVHPHQEGFDQNDQNASDWYVWNITTDGTGGKGGTFD
jgi:hypothetical protein